MKSRVKGDFHARFCGKAEVRFLCLTRLTLQQSIMLVYNTGQIKMVQLEKWSITPGISGLMPFQQILPAL